MSTPIFILFVVDKKLEPILNFKFQIQVKKSPIVSCHVSFILSLLGLKILSTCALRCGCISYPFTHCHVASFVPCSCSCRC